MSWEHLITEIVLRRQHEAGLEHRVDALEEQIDRWVGSFRPWVQWAITPRCSVDSSLLQIWLLKAETHAFWKSQELQESYGCLILPCEIPLFYGCGSIQSSNSGLLAPKPGPVKS